MTPLCIVAELGGPIVLPRGALALDSLLMATAARAHGLPPPRHADECVEIEIPIARDPIHGVYLCSFSEQTIDQHELKFINKRAPVQEYAAFGTTKIRRVQIQAGPNKSYRIPMELAHCERMTWWCIGDAERIRELLAHVHYLGKRRSVGHGKVTRWTVEECEPWEGFPVVREGKPLRPLPVDWPGLMDPPLAYAAMSPPYWDIAREQLCAVPEAGP